MTRPTDRQVREMCRAMTAMLGEIPDRLIRNVERERRGGPSAPDGYPTSGSGGGEPTGLGIIFEDEYGDNDRVTVTSVERAVFARMDGRGTDEHRKVTMNAQRKLDEAHVALGLVLAWLRKLDADATPTDPRGDEDYCGHHLKHDIRDELRMVDSPHCAFCDGLNRQYGALPPKALLVRRQNGERLTEAAIEASYGTLRQDAARKRVRGRAA